MSRPRGQGVLERDDDPFASAVESWIFPVSQSAGFDFSALVADAHRTAFSALHGALPGSPHPGNVTEGGSTSAFADITVQPLEAGALTFTLHNVGGVTPGSQAEAGFLRATALWQSFLGDTVNIRLDVGFSSLGPGILGSTGSAGKVVSYAAVRAALTADQSSSDDAAAVASLSAGASLAFFTNNSAGTRVFDNDGSANNTYLFVTTADLKALGITTDANGQPVDTGAADGSIRFSSDFTWDFDPGDGINAGAIDFVGVAFHEIGHALGFVSGVDTVDYYSGSGPGAPLNLNPYAIFSTLDLFRYSGNGVKDLSFGGSTNFSLNGGATSLASFSTGRFQGDGRQASHWKDNFGIGIMDPTSVPAGQANVITSRDIQALDVIGWNLASNQSSASVSISDLQISEGNNGTTVAAFTVTRSGSTAAFSVNFATSDGGAMTADNDYVATSGTLSFSTGFNTQTISVTINGDTKFEPDETFFVNLSGTTNGAIISDGQGIGTIGNDDRNPLASIHDFNGDRSGDLLWRHHGGIFTEWQSTGSGFTANVVVDGTVNTAWHSEGAFDFSGDGRADLLWRNDASGQFTIWNSTGTGFTQNSFIGNGVDTSWTVAGLADFNGDGKSDMLFRHTNGTFTEWQSTGNGFTPNVAIGTGVDNTWHLAATADFSGDGKADLLWRNDNGNFTEWQSTGNGFTPNVVNSTTVDTTWHILGTGDFNGDGKADLLFRNNSGTFTEWQSTGNGFTPNVVTNSTLDNSWHLAEVTDFNSDGKADLLWRNDNGTFTEWQSTGNSFTPNVVVDGTVNNDWTLITHHYDLV